jgi:hypothetical protein
MKPWVSNPSTTGGKKKPTKTTTKKKCKGLVEEKGVDGENQMGGSKERNVVIATVLRCSVFPF